MAEQNDSAAFSPAALHNALENAGMTPGELADELGAAKLTVAKWLAGISIPRPAMLHQTARILGVNPDALYN